MSVCHDGHLQIVFESCPQDHVEMSVLLVRGAAKV